MRNTILQGDCRDVFPTIPSETVQSVVTQREDALKIQRNLFTDLLDD